MRHFVSILAAVLTISSPVLGAGSITVDGVVNAPVAEVWKAWTTTEGLKSWLAPHADIDLRLGGMMRATYDANASLGDETTIENEIIAYDPERMLSIRVAKAPADFPFRDTIRAMWTVLYFKAEGEGRTHLTVVGLGFSEDEASQRMRQFFERGNAYTLEVLQKHFDSEAAK